MTCICLVCAVCGERFVCVHNYVLAVCAMLAVHDVSHAPVCAPRFIAADRPHRGTLTLGCVALLCFTLLCFALLCFVLPCVVLRCVARAAGTEHVRSRQPGGGGRQRQSAGAGCSGLGRYDRTAGMHSMHHTCTHRLSRYGIVWSTVVWYNIGWDEMMELSLCYAPLFNGSRGYLPVFATLNPQSTCLGPRPGPTLAPQCSRRLRTCHVTGSRRKDPRPEEQKMPMCKKCPFGT